MTHFYKITCYHNNSVEHDKSDLNLIIEFEFYKEVEEDYRQEYKDGIDGGIYFKCCSKFPRKKVECCALHTAAQTLHPKDFLVYTRNHVIFKVV